MTILYIFVILLGLIIGSFLNVCIYRIPRSESIAFPPSHCTSCGTRLKTIDLVPVLSYLFLEGKCRHCGVSISPRYAFVELLTGTIYAVLFYRYGISVEFAAMAFLMTILIAVFFIDMDNLIIPNGLVIAGIAGGLLLFVYNLFYHINIFGLWNWYNPLIGAVLGSGFLFIVALIGFAIYKADGAMGMGDVKIFIPIGLFLGWKLTIAAVAFSIFMGGIIGLLLMLKKIKGRKDEIPFGPFIVIGTFVAIMWGEELINWYIRSMLL